MTDEDRFKAIAREASRYVSSELTRRDIFRLEALRAISINDGYNGIRWEGASPKHVAGHAAKIADALMDYPPTESDK